MTQPTNEGLQIWEAFQKTDPEYTKDFKRAGGFTGTSISPMYAIKKMTEKFGPMGKGWGIEVANAETFVADDEVLIFVQVAIWWGETTADGKRFKHIVGPQWGGDKIVTKRKDGTKQLDDEAYKKAMTDGMLKCMSYLGIGADIHMGLYDDSKYVQQAAREFSDASTMPQRPTRTAASAAATPAASGSEKPNVGMTKLPEPDKAKEAQEELADLQKKIDNAWGIIQTKLLEKHGGDTEAAKKEAQGEAKVWLEGVDLKDKKAKAMATHIGQAKLIAKLNENKAEG